MNGHDQDPSGAFSCCGHSGGPTGPFSRRVFLGGASAAMMVAGSGATRATAAQPQNTGEPDKPFPPGKPLRVKPVLVYSIAARREKTSWRSYGGSITQQGIEQEARRIEQDLRELADKADFPIDLMPVSLAASAADTASAAASDCDALLVHAHSGQRAWLESLAASGKPNIFFVRHQTQPFYFWYETAHWWMLRKLTDDVKEPNLSVDDIVVDDYTEVLWRLRALYGLHNARGTRSVAIGGLAPYSEPAARNGPTHVKDVWGYDVHIIEMAEIERRVAEARADAAVMSAAQREAERLAAQPGVTLETNRRFLVNTFVTLKVFRDILKETGGANLGVAHCMGQLISVLDTTPCLALSILNDEGITAFCHTDYSHTPPGVLLRWIAGKPPFLCNTHFPHDGIMTVAHCAAPRRMNGRDFEPTKIMTHFESDYGAATKVEYAKGQIITQIIPAVGCTSWQGFRGTIIDSPAYDACRSQMNIKIDGDCRPLVREMVGFHAIVVYGDYLREVGYALGKLKIPWTNFSA